MNKKIRDKNLSFVIQISEANFKIVKSAFAAHQEQKISIYAERLAAGILDQVLAEKLTQALAKLGFNNNPVVVCLPRGQVTCRIFKVPSQDAVETEKILNFQASRYLPYQPSELISAFDTILKNKDGSAVVAHLIVHKNTIERYLKILKPLNPSGIKIALSSYGISGLFNPGSKIPDARIVMDFDSDDLEVAIFKGAKLLFSRAFKLSRSSADWQEVLVKELSRSIEAYAKETDQPLPLNCVILSTGSLHEDAAEVIKNKFNWQVEIFNYFKQPKLVVSEGALGAAAEYSFASLIGLSRQNIPDTLNLLPLDLKEELKRLKILKQRFKLLILSGLALLFLCLGVARDLDNKSFYLSRLRQEAGAVGKEAKNLVSIEKRLKLLDSRTKDTPQVVDFLPGINDAIPQEVYLSSFSYEANQIILRGQAGQLNSVLDFVSGIEKSKIFSGYQVKVRYATKRKSLNAEIVDFEIVCLNGQEK